MKTPSAKDTHLNLPMLRGITRSILGWLPEGTFLGVLYGKIGQNAKIGKI